jgi:hypothetical protein
VETVREGSDVKNGPAQAERVSVKVESCDVDSEIPDDFLNLIGGTPTVTIQIEGVDVKCLVDSGANVSTITESWFKTSGLDKSCNLKHIKWLEVKAANGKEIPYKGYFEADVFVGGVTVPSCGVLVTTDTPHTLMRKQVIPGVLGTNILGRLPNSDKLFQGLDVKLGTSKPKQPEVTMVKAAEAVCIPPLSQVDLKVKVGNRCGQSIMESLSTQLPGNLVLMNTLIDTDESTAYVRVANFGPKVVNIQARTRVGVARPVEILTEEIDLVVTSEEVIIGPVLQDDDTEVKLEESEDTSDWLPEGIDLSGVECSPEIWKKIKNVFRKHADAFVKEGEVGYTDKVQHRIPTVDDIPVRQPYRRVPQSQIAELKDHIQDLLRKGIIRESSSNYASPIVLCRRKNGKLRMCVDNRRLNSKTRMEVTCLPRVEECLDTLSGAKLFCHLDLASAYNQVAVHPDDQHKTAFITPFGLFEYLRVNFGLRGAPATFQKLMHSIFREEILDILLVILDDLLIHAVDILQMIDRLDWVLTKLKKYGLKLEPKKCVFFQKEVVFWGNRICEDGVAVDPEKIQAVKEYPIPQNSQELRRAIGLMGFNRRFVPGFSKIAAPLHALIVEMDKEAAGKKSKKNRKSSTKPFGPRWTEIHTEAFEKLRQALISPPVLGFADFTLPFVLETDASLKGLGAVLLQMQGKQKKVIAYASRGLKESERNYPVMKLEMLALVWAVTQKFRDYLIGASFVAYTDNNPLSYMMTTAKLGAMEQRWAGELASFDFSIKYKPGKSNVVADALSRRGNHPSYEELNPEEVAKLLGCTRMPHRLYSEVMQTSVRSAKAGVIQTVSDTESRQVTSSILFPGLESGDIVKLQENDRVIKAFGVYFRRGQVPSKEERSKESREVRKLVQQWKKIQMDEKGVLYRYVVDPECGKLEQILLPECLIEQVIKALHDKAWTSEIKEDREVD